MARRKRKGDNRLVALKNAAKALGCEVSQVENLAHYIKWENETIYPQNLPMPGFYSLLRLMSQAKGHVTKIGGLESIPGFVCGVWAFQRRLDYSETQAIVAQLAGMATVVAEGYPITESLGLDKEGNFVEAGAE